MEVAEFESKLAEIRDEVGKTLTELKATVLQEIEEKTKIGTAQPETKEKLDRLFARVDELDARLGNPETGTRNQPPAPKSLADRMIESQEFKAWQKNSYLTRPNRIPVGPAFGPSALKATTTTATIGSQSTGVIPIQRIDILDAMPMQRLTIRDLLAVRPVTSLTIDWLRQKTRTNAASPQVEGAAKVESTYEWESVSTPIRTIAHYFQVTKQALDDVPWLRREVDSELMFGLKLKEETELLSGDGLGSHIAGIIPAATAYDTALNVSGDTKLDKLRHAIYQARLALYPVDGIVMNPKDLHDIELIKTEEGAANKGTYVVGDPKSGTQVVTVWGRPVVESDSIASGKFLAGAFGFGAILFDRMEAVIDISFEHGTNFVENEATIRCENRVGLGIRRAGAFVYGSF